MKKDLTHLDEKGQARMVDVGDKAATQRRAVARGKLLMSAATVALVRDGKTPKGDVLATARVAGIQAAKRTSELIPLAHPLSLTHVSVDLQVQDDGIAIEATASTTAQTGVEMEALTARALGARRDHARADGDCHSSLMSPLVPPVFSTRRMSVRRAPRSTALSMS